VARAGEHDAAAVHRVFSCDSLPSRSRRFGGASAADCADEETTMTGPTLFHFALGAALLIPGAWFLRHQKIVLGWTLAVLGTIIGLMGVLAPAMHRYLHH